MTRTILHLDLDAFFCAVEEQHDPSLAGKPFAVGGRPEHRGVVASCSYPARAQGVRSAMPMSRALRQCPGLRIVPSHHDLYSQVSRQVMQRLRQLTPLVEQISIDEAFLDISELDEPGEVIARRLQATIRQELNLPCSLGVASNKLVSKIATDVGKAAHRSQPGAAIQSPNAITVVPPGEEAAFLAPLPVDALWGIGPKTAERLAVIDVYTIGELAALPVQQLRGLFGKNGEELAQRARGVDDHPIVTFHTPKSFSQEVTFVRDVADEQRLRETLHHLSSEIGRQLRKSGYACATIKLKLRWPDFTTITRQLSLSTPTDQDLSIYAAALSLFEKAWQKGKPVRLIGVGISRLSPPSPQLSLWNE